MKKLLTMDEVKKIELQILSTVADICDRNDLPYYLAYGTMLGAVRHKGFIPWDDDIDIFLKRSDYQKLLFALKAQKPEWMSVLDDSVEGYYYPFAKAVDNRTMAKMEDNVTPHGIWIDIFPEDNLPENDLERKIFIAYGTFLRDTIIAMTTDFTSDNLGKKALPKKILNFYASLVGKKKITEQFNQHALKYINASSKYVACLSTPYGQREMMDAKRVFKRTKFTFEGEEFFGPEDYDYYLGKLYGNYMQLPPVEKRRQHNIEAWYVK